MLMTQERRSYLSYVPLKLLAIIKWQSCAPPFCQQPNHLPQLRLEKIICILLFAESHVSQDALSIRQLGAEAYAALVLNHNVQLLTRRCLDVHVVK